MIPKKRDLADSMLDVLHAQKGLGRIAYPLSLRRLGELTNVDDSPALIAAARGRGFQSRAIVAKPGDLGALVAFWEDLEFLAAHSKLLRYALRASTTTSDQARSIAELGRHLTSSRQGVLQKAFLKSVRDRLTNGNLPSGIGSLKIQRTARLFFLDQVARGAEEVPAPEPEPREIVMPVNGKNGGAARPDFEPEFWKAFARLDAETGQRNFVSLHGLRTELGCFDRMTFDSWIRQLRSQTRISLAATQGGRNLSPDERESAIQEAGRLLVYVSKR